MSRIRTLMMMSSIMNIGSDIFIDKDTPKQKYTRGRYAEVRDSKKDPKVGRNELYSY